MSVQISDVQIKSRADLVPKNFHTCKNGNIGALFVDEDSRGGRNYGSAVLEKVQTELGLKVLKDSGMGYMRLIEIDKEDLPTLPEIAAAFNKYDVATFLNTPNCLNHAWVNANDALQGL